MKINCLYFILMMLRCLSSIRYSIASSINVAATISTSTKDKEVSLVSHQYYEGTNKQNYSNLPNNYELQKVIVITRHGDRAQIAPELGPKSPLNNDITKIWENNLPNTNLLNSLYMVADSNKPLPSDSTNIISKSIKEMINEKLHNELYTGWDAIKAPYGQLTEAGVNQLILVGKELRRRYHNFLNTQERNNINDILYCRSTNICRTMQSLRSLLVGLLDKQTENNDINNKDSSNIPILNIRPRNVETLFPQADGIHASITDRQKEIMPDDYLEKNYPDYLALDSKVRTTLGLPDKINWLTIKEVLTCYQLYNIKYPNNLNDSDVEEVTKLIGWMWGKLYNDDVLNRLSIGRLVYEIKENIEFGKHKMYIYSGHDSTLVPMLCALGIYDDVWPPYASFLTIEIAQDKLSEQLYVRSTYNDVDKPIRNYDNMWMPYELFMNHMNNLAISHDEYKQEECKKSN